MSTLTFTPHISRAAMVRLLVIAIALTAALVPFRLAHAATDCATVTDVTSVECETLVNIYRENNGSAWNNSTNWLDDDTVCDWYGVTCDNGHVVGLDLSNNNLTGTVSLSGIGNVLMVNLSGNDVVRLDTTDYLLLALAGVAVLMGLLLLSIFARLRGAKNELRMLEQHN